MQLSGLSLQPVVVGGSMVFCLENEEPCRPQRSNMVHFQASEVQQLLHNKFVVILGDSSECPSRIPLPGPAPAVCFLRLDVLSPSQTSFLIPSPFQYRFISPTPSTGVLTDVACQAFHPHLAQHFSS